MGKTASRCMKGCDGGKNEIGEANLEAIILNSNLPVSAKVEEEDLSDITKKARSGLLQRHKEPLDERKRKKLKKIKFI